MVLVLLVVGGFGVVSGTSVPRPPSSSPAPTSPAGPVSEVSDAKVAQALRSLEGHGGGVVPASELLPLTSSISWENITTSVGTPPSARVGTAITYDAAAGYVLLFGGENGAGTQLYSDTWKFSGGVWTNITTSVGTPPSPRVSAVMAYDVADGYVVLFGGLSVSGGKYLQDHSDTWKFSSGTWTNITASVGTPPAGRFSPGFAYDWAGRDVLLFGGESALDGLLNSGVTMYQDTWTFAGGKWTSITSSVGTPPSARSGVQMVYDPADSYVLLYGGIWNTLSGTTLTGYVTADTWRFASGTWTNITTSVQGAPGDRALAGIAYDALAGTVVMSGGCYAYVNEVCPLENSTWTYRGGTWTDVSQALSVAPAARGTMAMTNDSADGYLLFFGGSCGSGCAQQDTWREPAASATLSSVTFQTSVASCGPISVGGVAVANGASQALPKGKEPLTVGACAAGSFVQWNLTGALAVASPSSASTTLSISGGGSVTAWFTSPLGVAAASNTSVVGLGGSVSLTATAYGGRSPYSYQWAENGTNLTGAEGTSDPATLSFSHAATYTFLAWATDSDSSHAKSATFSVQVLASSPPPLTANLTLSSYYAPTGTQLEATATSTGGSGLTYAWTENGSVALACASTTCSISLPHGGTYGVAVDVTDSLGRSASSSSSVRVWNDYSSTPPSPLSITLRANATTVPLGSTITLNSTAVGGIPPYRWVVWTNITGNSSPLDGWQTNFALPQAGVYSLVMWVIDAAGHAASSPPLTITVTPPPSTACSSCGSSFPISPLLLGALVVALVAVVVVVLVVRHRRKGGGAAQVDTSAGSPTGPAGYAPGYAPAYAPGPGPPPAYPGYADDRAPNPLGGYGPR